MSENFSSGDSGIRLLCFATPSSEFVVIKIKEFQADYTSETLWKLNNSKSLYPTFTRGFLNTKTSWTASPTIKFGRKHATNKKLVERDVWFCGS